jgi:branched-chain amino acid transport system permease protein
MRMQRPLLVEALTLLGLIAAPFVLPLVGFAPNTVNRILVWGLFGIGFDILFGYTGLLSFGQSALYGTGGFVAAYLLTRAGFPYVWLALIVGTLAAAAVGYLVGLIALRRTGIYFAMITVAIAEVFYFVEFNPLAHWTGGENGLPGVPTPSLALGFTTLHFTTGWSLYPFLAFCYFIGIVLALRIVRSPVGAIFRAIRDNPLRAAALGHNIHAYKLAAFVIAAAYAGLAGGLLGVLQAFMPPEAFTFDTSGQLVMQTAIGGRGTLFGPLVGATVWLFLQDFLQASLGLGAAWKLVLGLVFVLLVCFLRQGIIGGVRDLYRYLRRKSARAAPVEAEPAPTASGTLPGASSSVAAAGDPSGDSSGDRAGASAAAPAGASAPAAMPARQRARPAATSGPILVTTALTKRYGGVVANAGVDFTVNHGELRGIIGPNGAGKTTFFRMLTCEVPPTSGRIVFEGRDITGMSVTDVCQLGLTKSYQVNQLFNQLTVRENMTIAVLAAVRGKFRLDALRSLAHVPGVDAQVAHTLDLVNLTGRAHAPVAQLAYGEKRRLEIGLALASSPTLLLLDEPLAGMSPRERTETVRLLKDIGRDRTMVVIDHDMDALFELAERITVLQEGRVLVEGTPEEIKGNARVQEAYLGGVHAELLA